MEFQHYESILKATDVFLRENWSVVLGVHAFIAVTCGLAMFLKSPALRGMFFSSQNTSSKTWMFCRVLNWMCSMVFLLTSTKVASDHVQMKNGLEHSSYDKLALTLCFLSLSYLIGFFSVSAVIEVPEDQPEEQESTSTSSSFGSVLIVSMVYFTAASIALLTLESSQFTLGAVTVAALVIITTVMQALRYSSKARTDFDGLIGSTRLLSNNESVLQRNQVKARFEGYDHLFSGARSTVGEISTDESIAQRKSEYKVMVDSFYDLVTDFYEYGWGQSFHFARRFKGEDFTASIARAEHYLALRLKLDQHSHVLDMGCGVGGPMRAICRFTGAKIDGITLNEYQVKVSNRYNRDLGLADKCHVVQGDFMNLPWEANTFDAIYAIESTCHAPDKTKCFAEALRVLKPGGLFVGYEWLTVNDYDPNNKIHVGLKEGIEVGNGLPTIVDVPTMTAALEAAGFEVVDHFDAVGGHEDPMEVPWYESLMGKMTLKGFRMTRSGRFCTHMLVTILEHLKIAPSGSIRVSQMLNSTADDLVEAGKLGIFSPDYFFMARKPLQ